ncbi:hypothetical protein Ocin01_09230 [Orchesella cincta]|uniref:Uncharacterized protein n=1 Tax=Orchesella cincta TaxID=48709 RepID=A0A1D2MWL8_ORCCI|nr:hypothetical protein Ocin01_09230 [Orchesella cincta]
MDSSTGNDDELCKVDQIPNGSGGGSGEPITKGKKKKNKGEQVNDAQQESGATPSAGNKESDQLSESNATVVVRQINQELAEFREQLKKSQELFSVLRFNSTQSISLTKSCPGLTVDQNEALSKSSSTNHNNKSVSCGTQTDSPVIETPVLAQKLALRSASTCAATQLSHQDHHHHHLNLMMSGGGLPDFMTNDSMDNPSFDKLSDDGR